MPKTIIDNIKLKYQARNVKKPFIENLKKKKKAHSWIWMYDGFYLQLYWQKRGELQTALTQGTVADPVGLTSPILSVHLIVHRSTILNLHMQFLLSSTVLTFQAVSKT